MLPQPDAGRINYSGDMRPGPVQLRVWQLSFRTDFGLANMIDPDELELLVEMILVEGFLGLPIWLGWTCWYASRLPLDQIESFSFTLFPGSEHALIYQALKN